MKVSYTWLQRFFDTPLPEVSDVERALTFHSSEIDEVIPVAEDTVFDVKVLPDKSAWLLSHRGVAKELSVILDRPMAHDPLVAEVTLEPRTDRVVIVRNAPGCDRYAGVLIEGVAVGPSPAWLVDALSAIGQRSINNVVDATNYVMFHIGQPLHAFDADKIVGDVKKITVRHAREGESIVSLTGETYTLSGKDMLIVDGTTDAPLGIAGIKGGKAAEVDAGTKNIFIECAHFDRTTTRLSSQRLKLRTDASSRFENGIVSGMVGYGLMEIAKLVPEIAGGSVVGFVDNGASRTAPQPVAVSVSKINAVLGITLTPSDVSEVMRRFGYVHAIEGDTLTLTPPFERDDLVIAEDVIEEVGRIHGLVHVPSRALSPRTHTEVNVRFYYADKIRSALAAIGFSEVYTSSFREKDAVALENALASDKGYLRSSLERNIDEVLARNVPYKDLLGLQAVRVFEIGAVFPAREREVYMCTIGVRTGQAYQAKKDDPLMTAAKDAIHAALGVECVWSDTGAGIASLDLDALVQRVPVPDRYEGRRGVSDLTYAPFSPYPFITRDIALWVDGDVPQDEIEHTIRQSAGPLLLRLTFFDRFEKEGKVSYAFRLVFQSFEKTLTDADAGGLMEGVVGAVMSRGWQVR